MRDRHYVLISTALHRGMRSFLAATLKGATPEKFVAGTKAFRAFVDTLELKEVYGAGDGQCRTSQSTPF